MASERNTAASDNTSRRSNKKIIFIIIIVLLLFIPIVWAFVNAKAIDNKGFFGTQFEISLYDSQNDLIVSDASVAEYSSARSAVSIFYNIISNMQRTNSNSIDISSLNEPLVANIKINNAFSRYNFYFSENGTSYCFDRHGQAYIISENDATAFMNSSYSETVYSSSKPPLLATGNNEVIFPDYIEWYYKNTIGSFTGASPISDPSKLEVYEISGSLDITFADTPDVCKIKVFRDDALIFNGTYEDLSNMIIDTGTRLKVEITAEWIYDTAQDYYGSAFYAFYADIKNYADFSVNTSEVSADGFIIVSGSNIESISKIEFSPVYQDGTFPYTNEPIFIPRGENAYCILPFPADWERGNYCFNITYGTFSKDFNILFTDSANETPLHNSNQSFETIYYYTGNEVQKEFSKITKEIPLNLVDDIYFTNSFLKPEDLGYLPEYSYSSYISCDDGSLVYSALGNRYYNDTKTQTDVFSLNGGKVIFKGKCEYLGTFVVIEHGLGIRTWYCNLSHVSVDTGDIVAQGEKIGRSGTHPTASKDGFLLLCSVYDTFVDINCCLDEKTILK